jgi:ubiquinone/menaquinone biosynthesis C-methylase UbiE
LFGGLNSAIAELREALKEVPLSATLLDVGSGLGDIPHKARDVARREGIDLTTIGLDSALELSLASRGSITLVVCGDGLKLPFADKSVDIVMCSQFLHHFTGKPALQVLREMDRVARCRVIVSDLRRSWIAAAGLWLMSFPLRFHAVSRHDGVVSVLRGFTAEELTDTVRQAVPRAPTVRKRPGFRVTASWSPAAR